MISNYILFESIPNKWRNRVEVYILKDNKILVGKHPEIGYQVPGGGVEQGQTLFTAAKQECLEEVGAKIKNIKITIPNNFYEDWYKLVEQGQKITKKDKERMKFYRGIKHNFLKADFIEFDKSILGSDNDELKNIVFMSKIELIREFRKQGKSFEPELYNIRIKAINSL